MPIERSKFSSHLSPADVAEIRAAPLPTRHADLAREYNVSPTTIARIRRGETWPEERPEEVRVRVPAHAVPGLEQRAKEAGLTPEELLARAAVRESKRAKR